MTYDFAQIAFLAGVVAIFLGSTALILKGWLGQREAIREFALDGVDPNELSNAEPIKSSDLPPSVRRSIRALLTDGKVVAAADLLASAGLIRESITLLIGHREIGEATKVLLRQNRYKEAGDLNYANERWAEAGRCYYTGQHWPEAAKAAERSGDHRLAAKLYGRAGLTDKEARALSAAGEHLEAARTFLALGERHRALECYIALADENPRAFQETTFNAEEKAVFLDYLAKGYTDRRLLYVVREAEELGHTVLALIAKRKVAQAEFVYERAALDLDRILLKEANYLDHTGADLADMLFRLGRFDSAARAYELCGMGEAASQAYEQAGDLKRALQAALDASAWERAETLRRLIRETPDEPRSRRPESVPAAPPKGLFKIDEALIVGPDAVPASPRSSEPPMPTERAGETGHHRPQDFVFEEGGEQSVVALDAYPTSEVPSLIN